MTAVESKDSNETTQKSNSELEVTKSPQSSEKEEEATTVKRTK